VLAKKLEDLSSYEEPCQDRLTEWSCRHIGSLEHKVIHLLKDEDVQAVIQRNLNSEDDFGAFNSKLEKILTELQ
jgi:hypothetical protein